MTLAIIGGSGLYQLAELENSEEKRLETPYGSPSSAFICGQLHGKNLVFLPRHGAQHSIPPHQINYRANIWGVKQLGVSQIIAVAAVGGITSAMQPAALCVPDQLIDYSYGREHTFFADNPEQVTHIDFTWPYTESLRQQLLTAAEQLELQIEPQGTYGCTQGPRLETAAEIKRMENDGCDLVGMTGMPEAALAREMEMEYAALAVVANWAAGKTDEEISMDEIVANLDAGMEKAVRLLQAVIAST